MKVLTTLIKAKCDVLARRSDGISPSEMANIGGYDEVFNVLVEMEVQTQNMPGWHPRGKKLLPSVEYMESSEAQL